ncbi:MAG: RagB/SusD family nutrient uptake outer membrane protein [Muribaculaceae bacterium]|nr:RagB/SusD family nutrient uptake outer membrane protein [Muribaculaceae bacterium]
MKKTYLLGLAGLALLFASCNDMLDVTPRDTFTNDPAFWNNENQVQNYTNGMYTNNFSGYGTGIEDPYFSSLTDDQADPDFENWTFTTAPANTGYWSTPYSEIRRCNYLLDNMEGSSISDASKAKYSAIARLMRAYNYFRLVKRFGDVQWQDHVVMSSDDELVKGPRDDRDFVMDKVLEDLDYAIANIGSGNKATWSTDLALAIKSDICLYEGTYCKYRTQADNGKGPDAARAQKYLNECVDASQKIMNGGYTLTANYGDIYNSLDLSANKEIIFYRKYVKDMLGHSTVDYTSGSTAQRGITKDAIDAFLFLDGKPLATTSLNKSDLPEKVPYYMIGLDGKIVKTPDGRDSVRVGSDGKPMWVYSMEQPFSVRDKRLSKVVDKFLAFKGYGHARTWLAEMTSSTGYTIGKYYTTAMGTTPQDQLIYCNEIGKGYTDAPIYYLSRVLLNYAEAKAELGTATQADLNKSVNLLQARAGLPNMTINPEADPANKVGVSNLIWEIRRARRCELMTDGVRYWDLVRWHMLDKLDTNKYPDIKRGANLSNVENCEIALDGGYAIPFTATRTYDKKYYFYPIPTDQINASGGATTQNPGW